MSRLEDLKPNASVQGIMPSGLVTVVNVQWHGSDALELTYKTAEGKVANKLLYRHDEPRIEVVEQGRPWSFDGDGALFRLVSETMIAAHSLKFYLQKNARYPRDQGAQSVPGDRRLTFTHVRWAVCRGCGGGENPPDA
jgi:hypothetical protein